MNLIQLSLILLTEYTRSLTSTVFLRSSEKSVQAVVIIAFALRGLICRTTEKTLMGIDRFLLGNVFFSESDIPSGLLEVSTIMAFTDDRPNKNRLESKLKISTKEYKEMQMTHATPNEDQPQSEDEFEMESDEIFNVLSDEEENLNIA